MTPERSDALKPPRHDWVRGDWSARARSSAMDALRYTRFVGVMKRALSVAAFAVIVAVLGFFFVQRQPARLTLGYERLGTVENDLAMMKPRLSGQDSRGNPFVITADAAIQDARNTKRARLVKVEADLNMTGDGWINAKAANGFVDMERGQLELNGGISVFSDSGYELHSRSASVDLRKGVVHGHDEVTGHGPLGSLRADQYHFDRDSKQLLLGGNVQMMLIGKKS